MTADTTTTPTDTEGTPTTEPTTTATAPAAPAVPTARFPLPAGVVPPITLRNELVKRGLAPETLKPQQMYAWVKSPGKTDAFPVKWYDVAGNEYDKQPAGDGAPLTRPGLTSLEAGIEWYRRRATPAPATPAAPVATATPTEGAAPVATVTTPEDESEDHEEAE